MFSICTLSITIGPFTASRIAFVTSCTNCTRCCTAEMAVYWPNTFSTWVGTWRSTSRLVRPSTLPYSEYNAVTSPGGTWKLTDTLMSAVCWSFEYAGTLSYCTVRFCTGMRLIVSKIGSLKPRPGSELPTTAPLRRCTPRSPWSIVYQLPMNRISPTSNRNGIASQPKRNRDRTVARLDSTLLPLGTFMTYPLPTTDAGNASYAGQECLNLAALAR